MYLWVACDVDNQLKDFRNQICEISNQFEIINPALTLPLHISLRISFYVNENIIENVIEYILNYYSTLKSFEVEIDKIEKHENIIWFKIKENSYLEKIHFELVNLLQEKFNIHYHEFDKDFLFHITLFNPEDNFIFDKVYEKIISKDFPKKLFINKFIIGSSNSGKSSEYKVIKEIFV